MKLAQTLALITPGAVNRTPFARLGGLRKVVTHVVAPDFRQASRIANGMPHAHACRTLSEARQAHGFLLCAPGQIEPLAQLLDNWRHRHVLIALDEPHTAVRRFHQLGASTAVLTVVDELTPARLFVEGDTAAVAWTRKTFSSAGVAVTETGPGGRVHLTGARVMLGPLLMAMAEFASRQLRQAGLPLDASRELIGKLALETLRVHQRSGARTWRRPDAASLIRLAEQVGKADPWLAGQLTGNQTFGFIGGKSRAGQAD